MPRPALGPVVEKILRDMEGFEAAGSVANTGTGARREGEAFERLIAGLWEAFREVARSAGARQDGVATAGSRRYASLTVASRTLYVPTSPAAPSTGASPRWLEVAFGVSELIAAFPTEARAIRDYAPNAGPHAGEKYPNLFSGLTTRFDDTVVLVDGGVLREKIMLEYKTAKSTAGRQIDGNAHERLSFQILQYLEVATRYTKCSLVVLANGAFVRYRNKYHVNFRVQADRLSNFSWFEMTYACTVHEYTLFLASLLAWLFEGTPRSARSAR